MSENGFIKLRRGLDEHLDRIDGDALRLYIRMQFRADWRRGDSMGLVTANLADLVSSFGWNRWKRDRAIAELKRGGYVTVIKTGNQHSASVFRIEKYDDASRTNAVSTGELPAKNSGACRTNAASDAVSTLLNSPEIKRPEGAKKLEERRSSSKNSMETKMFDPDDRLFIPTGKRWKGLGIGKLSERFRPFIELGNKIKPKLDETVAGWCGKVIDACQSADVEYPPQFLAITRRYREHDVPCFSTQARIEEEQRRRGTLTA